MTIRLTASDGVELEATWDAPGQPDRVLVFCHPHPLHQGTMTAPLMSAVTKELVADGFVVLRFNFRGVGGSDGTHDLGISEMDDIHVAVTTARSAYPDLPLAIAGWSFGAATALRWQAREGSTLPYVGIAPPVVSDRTPALPAPADLAPAQRTFIVGDRDQFVTTGDLSGYAASIGADIEILTGSDHFFYFREAKVAATMAEALRRG